VKHGAKFMLAVARCIARMRLNWLGLHPVRSAVCLTVWPAAHSATVRLWAVVFAAKGEVT
jgi:hypothetical protein